MHNAGLKNIVVYIILIFVVLFVVFAAHYRVVGTSVYGDGRYYYGLTRSIILRGSFDLSPELAHKYGWNSDNGGSDGTMSYKEIKSWFPVGTSLSWIPSFAAADVISHIMHGFFPVVRANGYSVVYQFFVGMQNIFFVVGGLIFIFLFLRNFYPKIIAASTAVLYLFGTNLLFYGGVDVINSHPLSFLLGSFFIYVWWMSRRKRTFFVWLLLGFTLGFLAMVRTQDVLFGVLLLFDLPDVIRNFPGSIISILAGFVAGFFPQAAVWRAEFGSYFKSPYLSGGFEFLHPHILGVLFNTKTGLVLWTPLLAIAVCGLVVRALRNEKIDRLALCFVGIQLWVIASWSGWNQAASFGVRMMLSASSFYALGLAYAVKEISDRFKTKAYFFLAVSILLNCTFIVSYLLFVQG